MKCPDCNRDLVERPAGHTAVCGRRVSWGEIEGLWAQRLRVAMICAASSSDLASDRLTEFKQLDESSVPT